MFPNFTGTARRPRQVNLSGRQNANPFAKGQAGGPGGVGSGSYGGSPAGRGAALANAQQDRLLRQQERERAQSAKLIQRVWRGSEVRRSLKAGRRALWDESEQRSEEHTLDGQAAPAYGSDEEALSQLWLLLYFVDLRDDADMARLQRFESRWTKRLGARQVRSLGASWAAAYIRLEKKCAQALVHAKTAQSRARILSTLYSVAMQIPEETARHSSGYYHAFAYLLARGDTAIDVDALAVPLQATSPVVFNAYEDFATMILSHPLLDVFGKDGLSKLAGKLNHNMLGRALAERIRSTSDRTSSTFSDLSRNGRVWLLSHFIYIYGFAHNFRNPARYSSEEDFILVVGTLLSSLVDEIELESSFNDFEDDSPSIRKLRQMKAVDPFVKDQISSLVNQESIGGLLGFVGSTSSTTGNRDQGNHSRVLASYILTLLRLFPRRGDEIRMWLYLGLRSSTASNERPPVIRYFWQAASGSDVFRSISQDSRSAIQLLQSKQENPSKRPLSDSDDQWRVILIFFELYIFVLKVMDDEEFFADGQSATTRTLTLNEIRIFTIFLKNLGFTMYYNAADIAGDSQQVGTDDISKLFRVNEATTARPEPRKPEEVNIAGVQGVSLDYVKGLVTGILRQIYARDSRRPFLPKNHWLMTSRFDMTNFIDAVVEEEERRHSVQQQDDEEEMADDVEEAEAERVPRLVGASHAAQTMRIHQMQRQQRKASRKRYLQAVAPRLEILQNMPFLIPFTTRVQIFRRFVYLDQYKRRHGNVDGELWRMNQMHDPMRPNMLARHHAKIRREHEFDDAYQQYFDLGAGLKEPIQITFVDKFGTVEAGIDGGGVTKEFLTSVTNQAFAPTNGIDMFAENDQHLLFPNPAAIDEQREYLRSEIGVSEEDPDFRTLIQDLLKRYEFLGRIIGKCLYEGILIDIGFAGFFLLKWALTGGTGSAPRESGYRASINDLRDFDESLYQGLLQLKNYPGDVEEDFALNFTVTDTLSVPGSGKQKTITRDLKPGGSQIPVTNANRLVYIADVSRHRLQTQPYHQTNAFLRGLASIVEPSWLSMFNQSELQTLVGGAQSSISVPDLRSNTIYGGVYVIGDDGQEHPSVKIFWDVMEALPDEDRRKVLKFVTSTPRAPLLGFGSLNPRFCIRDGGGDEERLPSTSTCVNLLKLPRYSNPKACRTKLLQAVNSGAGFDLS